MSYVMGIDVGTTGCKVVLFETKEKTIKRAYEEYKIDVPRSGWAEQNPEVWWSATKRCIRKSCYNLDGSKKRSAGGKVKKRAR